MRKSSGFTLIELMIVVSIIAIIASIAIPNLMSARRNSNRSSALGTVKNFSAAALSYCLSSEAQSFWFNGTTDFAPHFSHVATKAGYRFSYFSDDTVDDGTDEGHKFIYFAYPVSPTSGDTAFYIDEANSIWERPADTEAQITAISTLVPDWDKEAGLEDRLGGFTHLGTGP